MTEQQNEIITQQPFNFAQTVQQPLQETIHADTPEYTIYRQVDGEYRKEMKYQQIVTSIPQTEEEMIALYKILEVSDNPDVTPMKKVVGEEFQILNFYMNPYQSFDKKTGGTTNGVATTIQTDKGYIATSSKTVYHTLNGLVKTFGMPNTTNYVPIKVIVTETKQPNGMQINIELVGF